MAHSNEDFAYIFDYDLQTPVMINPVSGGDHLGSLRMINLNSGEVTTRELFLFTVLPS